MLPTKIIYRNFIAAIIQTYSEGKQYEATLLVGPVLCSLWTVNITSKVRAQVDTREANSDKNGYIPK